ncbi:Acetolactate synthase, chloroplastic [Vitis vinifera]|uniref:acetolactate synthase n=1 Tax=Vitis vinifera TaxID=29760 RepID=A0A438JDC4_VITVI|nr:Acetolactate synthase, chloroplastic [Vitis vinifera]
MASTAATAAANLSISKPSPTLSFQSLTSHSRLILPGSKAKITVSVAHRITASLSDPKPNPHLPLLPPSPPAALHEQGGVFAAEGYARASGRPGVCIATSGPGATNLVSGLADALLDSIPIVAITGQVPRRMIGTDAFQETQLWRYTTAARGSELEQGTSAAGYTFRLPKSPEKTHLEQIVRLISESKRPVLYVGGGCMNSSEELRRFVDLTGIPVASTLMVLVRSLHRQTISSNARMHGTMYANYAVDRSDLLLAFGVRFDDRVTGKIEAFASRAKIVHIDIDPAEIGKNKQPHVSVCADVKQALTGMNSLLEETGAKSKYDFSSWRDELNEQKAKYPLSFKTFGEAIPPQYAIQVLDELTNGNAIISSGVGQHQMWAAQFYKYKGPRQWLSSSGLGAMGFGLPAAMGAAVAKPDAVVVDIGWRRKLIMNVQDCDIPAARVTKKSEVREAIKKMLETPGPYLLDVIVPHQEHVLPMIPSGGAFKDAINEGDGREAY